MSYNNNNSNNFLHEKTVANLLSWNGYLAQALQWGEPTRYLNKKIFGKIMNFIIQYIENMVYQSNNTTIPDFG
jgi:hypothetical protein